MNPSRVPKTLVHIQAVAYAENIHGGGFGSGSYGHLHLVCAVCDVTI